MTPSKSTSNTLAQASTIEPSKANKSGGGIVEPSDYSPAVGDVVEFEYAGKMIKAIVYMDSDYGLSSIDSTSRCNGYNRILKNQIDILRKVGEVDASRLTGFAKAREFAKAYFSAPTFTGSYAERQKQWIEYHGLKVGSEVKVVRKFKTHEDGCNCAWFSPKYNDYKDSTVEIVCINSRELVVGNRRFYTPYFALEPVS
jgi:hypothetical protein